MKFNRLALIERLQTQINSIKEVHEYDCMEWSDRQYAWKVETVQTQREKLEELGNQLIGLSNILTKPLAEKDLPKVTESTSRFFTYSHSLSSLVSTPPHHFEIAGRSLVDPGKEPKIGDRQRMIDFLSRVEDEFVTSNGLVEHGFRDGLKYL